MKLLTDDVLLGNAVDVSAIGLLEEIKGDSILSYASDTRSASQLGASSSFISTFDGLSGQVGTIDPSAKFTQIASTFSFSDIAVAKDGTIFGITPTQLFKIDPVSGLTSFVGGLPAGVNINALEFANDNILYGAGDSNLYAINTTNAGLYLIANLESTGFNSSGDLAFDAPNNRFLATSKGLTSDSLYAVSLTGEAAKIGDIGFSNILGLMFEGEKLFGFTADGSRILINPGTGAGVFDTLVKGISDRIGGASGIQIKKGEVLSSTPGTILSADTIDVFLPPGSEITLEITVTVPGDGSEPIRSVRSIENGDRSASVVTNQLPLDVFLLQDLSGSFDDDLPTVRRLVPNLVSALQKRQPDSTFGVASFTDKPIDPFGISGDYVYRLNQQQTTDATAIQSTVNNLTVRDGSGGVFDGPEAQLEGLLQTALRSQSEIGFRDSARRVVVVATDAEFHQAGDGKKAGITKPNNLDTILDGNPPGTGEDYPSVPQVRQALINANLVPVFAVTKDQIATYRDLVDDSDGDGLGFGSVVELKSDSSNLVDAIVTGLDVVGREINVVPVSDEFGYVKEITPPKFTDVLPGQKLTFRVKLKSDGKGGNDTLNLRALGFGDTKINIVTSAPSRPPVSTPGETPETASDLGELKGGRTITGVVGGTEKGENWYKFTNSSPSTFGLLLSGLTENADVELFNSDAKTKTLVDSQYKFDKDKDTKDKDDPEKIYSSSLPTGTYYIRVSKGKDANTKYDVNVSVLPESTDELVPTPSVNGLRFDGRISNKGEKRTVNIRVPDGSDSLKRGSIQDVPTWVVTHGLTDAPDAVKNIGKLANAIEQRVKDIGGQVLVLDWSSAADKYSTKFSGIPNPATAANYIHNVADFAVRSLKQWGIKPENINLVGHSLGAYVSSEIGFIFSSKDSKDRKALLDGSKVNSITALDIAAATDTNQLIDDVVGAGISAALLAVPGNPITRYFNLLKLADQTGKLVSNLSYNYDLNGNTPEIDTPIELNKVSKFSRAFWGPLSRLDTDVPDLSLRFGDGLGSEYYAHSANESIRVRFDGFNPQDNHGNIVKLYENILRNPSAEIGKLFKIGEEQHKEWKEDAYGGDEGVIVVKDPNQSPSLLVVKNANTQNDEIVYGSTRDDKLDGSNLLGIDFGVSGNSIFTGSGNDKIFGDAGNDEINGDSGDDTLIGGAGNDTLIGGDGLFDSGKDVLEGGKGNDSIRGGGDIDILTGGTGSDTLDGGGGDDILYGGTDKDQDILIGGPGNSVFLLAPDIGLSIADKANRDKVDIIEDFRAGISLGLFGRGGDSRGISGIGLINGLKVADMKVETFGDLFFNEKTAVIANNQYLAVIKGGWFNKNDLNFYEIPNSPL